MTSMTELFDGLETYPGSKQKRGDTVTPPVQENANPFAGVKGRELQVGNRTVEFFTIGQLASALDRQSVTIRKWEREGVIPRATFTINVNEHKDQRARRRLYSREQVEGIWQIARDEGILGGSKTLVGRTQFSARVAELFTALREGN